jgi:hypothetical protein
MNQPHPAQVAPSWYGDSVGRYEGDTLVIDTVGIKVGPYSMIDLYGTPYTNALHVVERYRLLDYEATKGALAQVANENFRLPPDTIRVVTVGPIDRRRSTSTHCCISSAIWSVSLTLSAPSKRL